ncbi:glycosyltransferase family 4 protein [Geodermatophilus sp. CPCC 206100]|uniref:glycosyltransferase family 4 protein n=1 Tax=Geodermatophilus sp. CPCC 206100 TaxID=3020054 RepID=UPI003B00BCFF
MEIPASARTQVETNRERYDALVDLVRAHARRGDVERVLTTATVAAHSAWIAPTGRLTDPELERLVRDAVGGGPGAVQLDPDREDGRVLHVLTETYATGGHTRLARRWIEQDSTRQSDVVLTMQGHETPGDLREAVTASGGRVYDLQGAFPAFTRRVAALRRLMDRADLVVLHVHPYDTVALAAAALPGPRPPIIVEDHADHTYWLGLGSADVVANLRTAAATTCRERRGIRPERLALLPLPIDAPTGSSTRKSVRKQLGLRPRQVAALTVATWYKLEPLWGDGFDGLLRRALTDCPDLVVVLVGVSAEGLWSALQAQFPGRVHALGYLADPGALHAGVDVYLNSYPVSSGTSVLEAGAAGLPVLSLHDHEHYGDVYQANSPGLAHTGHGAASVDEYLAALRRLVDDPEHRRERGDAARREVLGTHTGPEWAAALERLYARARAAEVADLDEYAALEPDVDYAASLVPLTMRGKGTPDAVSLCGPLGDRMDQRMQFDLYLATHERRGRRLSVRVSRGWEDSPAWVMRLAELAKRHPQLSVSLPFVAGDDVHGSRSLAALEPVLAANGDTPADCGDLSLDVRAPRPDGPSVTGELALQSDSLDSLELLLTSPCWDGVDVAALAGP